MGFAVDLDGMILATVAMETLEDLEVMNALKIQRKVKKAY